MMTRLNFFRALNPSPEYSTSPFNVTAHGVKYDLPVPDFVADALAYELSPTGTFFRAEEFCRPTGMDVVRADPATLESFGRPAYAESSFRLNLVGFGRLPMGCFQQQALASESTATAILGFAIEEKRFTKDVADWIVDRSLFFLACRGFEIARFAYYFDGSEKNGVDSYAYGVGVSQQPKSVMERAGRRLRFRDMVRA